MEGQERTRRLLRLFEQSVAAEAVCRRQLAAVRAYQDELVAELRRAGVSWRDLGWRATRVWGGSVLRHTQTLRKRAHRAG